MTKLRRQLSPAVTSVLNNQSSCTKLPVPHVIVDRTIKVCRLISVFGLIFFQSKLEIRIFIISLPYFIPLVSRNIITDVGLSIKLLRLCYTACCENVLNRIGT